MFPFQRSCELSFQISDEGDQIEHNSLEDQIMLDNNAFVGLNNNTSTSINPRGRGRGRGRGRRLVSPLAGGTSNNNTTNNDEERKILHREYERQRRQDMANLFNSLRATLPAELIQGKRSITDHVGEAINYIEHLKKNVKDLEEKKSQLKQSVDSLPSSTNELGESSIAGLTHNSVVIKQSVVGLEVEIGVGIEDNNNFSLSSALLVVFEEGLEVVSCTSTTFNGRLVHNLQCKVENATCIDVDRLRKRLSDLVS